MEESSIWIVVVNKLKLNKMSNSKLEMSCSNLKSSENRVTAIFSR